MMRIEVATMADLRRHAMHSPVVKLYLESWLAGSFITLEQMLVSLACHLAAESSTRLARELADKPARATVNRHSFRNGDILMNTQGNPVAVMTHEGFRFKPDGRILSDGEVERLVNCESDPSQPITVKGTSDA